MEVIKVSSAEEVQKLYEDNGVNETRTKGVNDKFVVIPDEFTVYGLTFKTITIAGEENPNVPVLSINEDGSKYITVGTFKQSYTDKDKASKITKETSDQKGHFLVVNNRRVHPFTEGLSEAEIIAFCQGKTFKARKAKDLNVFQPKYVNKKPVYPATEAEALAMIKPKSFRVIYPKDEI